jgi:F420-0:gamma-glutamyl ligase-like protein
MPVPPLNDRKKERKRNESQNQMIKKDDKRETMIPAIVSMSRSLLLLSITVVTMLAGCITPVTTECTQIEINLDISMKTSMKKKKNRLIDGKHQSRLDLFQEVTRTYVIEKDLTEVHLTSYTM